DAQARSARPHRRRSLRGDQRLARRRVIPDPPWRIFEIFVAVRDSIFPDCIRRFCVRSRAALNFRLPASRVSTLCAAAAVALLLPVESGYETQNRSPAGRSADDSRSRRQSHLHHRARACTAQRAAGDPVRRLRRGLDLDPARARRIRLTWRTREESPPAPPAPRQRGQKSGARQTSGAKSTDPAGRGFALIPAMTYLFTRAAAQGLQAFVPVAVLILWLRTTGRGALLRAVACGVAAAVPATIA